jgi:hypothetical protein
MNKVITIQKGNSYSTELQFTDESVTPAVPYNLTGKTISFTVKIPSDNSGNDNKAVIKKDWNIHSNASGGISRLDLNKKECNIPAGSYVGDFKINGVNTETCDVIVIPIVTTR